METLPDADLYPHLLIVDDDADLRDSMAAYLSQHGYVVRTVADGVAMDEVLAERSTDLVVLDVMMRGEDGLSICRRLRQNGGPPIVMVSAVGDEIDRVLGLELGADDYLAKPCSPRELLARIRAVLRRGEDRSLALAIRARAFYFQGFTLDGARRQLRAPNGLTILLTSGEMALLTVFLENPQRVLSRDELIGKARGGQSEVFDRAIDVQISRLRRKLHDCSPKEIIKTHRGAGYLFDAHVSRP